MDTIVTEVEVGSQGNQGQEELRQDWILGARGRGRREEGGGGERGRGEREGGREGGREVGDSAVLSLSLVVLPKLKVALNVP